MILSVTWSTIPIPPALSARNNRLIAEGHTRLSHRNVVFSYLIFNTNRYSDNE